MINIKKKIKDNLLLSKIIIGTFKYIFKLLGWALPQNKRRIVFESFMGKQISDNPKAIFEYISLNFPDYKLYWSVEQKDLIEDSNHLNLIKRFSLKWIYFMATSKYWISNSRLPLWLPKPRKTIYVQTWHGTPLKKIGIDIDEVHMVKTNTKEYKESFLSETSRWDYLISPNQYSTRIFKKAFNFNKRIIESGYPRNDFLVNFNYEEEIKRLKYKMKLPLDKKVILYAPTWRDNQYDSEGKYNFKINLDLKRMYDVLVEDYIIVLRFHYLVSNNIDIRELEGFVYDFSKYEDIRELYLISDLLITDYSSVFFDYSILKRPMLFYIYDIEEYKNDLRGFYFNFEEKAPGPLVQTTDQLLNAIKSIEEKGYSPSKEIVEFYEQFTSLEDGKATERVVKALNL
ncbi:CDP-glycerol glycerophosphotransferase family protein [Ornithinibacillus bavariensis]|uniref:CDP-glycerol glycerophosphotransferase family protein n=1 Tax=Ornithinibacillus bavariensis TaxID=545502 RepID=UPI003D1BD63A